MSNKLLDKFKFYQGDYPLPQELELMAEAERRVSLMIKARWLFLLLLGVYEFCIILSMPGGIWGNIIDSFFVPVAAFILMVTFNLWYQGAYKNFSHLRGGNYIQIVMDIVFALIVVHYTGGVLSWAWLVYPLIVVEAAVLLEKKIEAWSIVFLASLLYGLLLVVEAYMPKLVVQVPFLTLLLQNSFTHDFLFWVRFTLIIIFFAFVSNYLMGVIRKDEEKLKAHIITDSLTELYSNTHFLRCFNSEIKRAKRYNQPLSLLLIGINNFSGFNQRFGYLEGNQVLRSVAILLKHTVRSSDDDPPYDIDIACRYEGDKFAIILPNTSVKSADVPAGRIKEMIKKRWQENLPKELQAKVTEIPTQITVRVGAAGYPEHGDDYQQILKLAEDAIAKAADIGRE